MSAKTFIKEYLFGTWDRKYTFLSAFLSVVSIFLTIFLLGYPDKTPFLIIIRDIIIYFGLITICGVLLWKYIKREQKLTETIENLKDSNENLFTFSERFAKNFHLVNHHFRNELFKNFYLFGQNRSDLSQKDRKIFEKICHSITTEVRKSFINYFNARKLLIDDDIVITVKLAISSSCILNQWGSNFNDNQKEEMKKKEQWILTVFRDPDSYERYKDIREVGVKLYDINKNTAFIHIFNEKKHIFFSDDLSVLGEVYLNENIEWKNFYNSTAVAPIRYYDSIKGKFIYFGLIAVDSKNEKKYNLYSNKETTHILGHAADLLANYFLTLSLIPSSDVSKETLR